MRESVLALGASLGLLWSAKALETRSGTREVISKQSAKKSKNQQSTPLVWETGRPTGGMPRCHGVGPAVRH
jgi:hypothetical protein